MALRHVGVYLGVIMPAPTQISGLEVLERNYVRKALDLLEKSLERSRNTDSVGGELWNLREKEIGMVRAIKVKL